MSASTSPERLGRYNLVRRLAVGGMAELFLAKPATSETTDEHVVLKRILPEFADREEHRQMFVDEARLCATLDHPHVVRALDITAVEEDHFFSMELVSGVNLRHVLVTSMRRRGGVPMQVGLAAVLRVASGLHYAHEKKGADGEPLGLVHRDVSMGNVLVGFDGSVKLADFGVAKFVGQESKTGRRILKGKIGYMSPEQCLGKPLDRRSDVFSLGIVLYEVTTGKKLFGGKTDYEILQKTVNGVVPPPSRHRFDYPAELEAIVMRALATEREERYPTAQAFAADLARFCDRASLAISDAELSRYMRELYEDDAPEDGSCDQACGPERPYRFDDARECDRDLGTDDLYPIIGVVTHESADAPAPEGSHGAAAETPVETPVKLPKDRRFRRRLAQGTVAPSARADGDGLPSGTEGLFPAFGPRSEVEEDPAPRDAGPLLEDANRHLSRGSYESARTIFGELLEIHPADRIARAGGYLASACMAVREGRQATANQYLAFALGILPNDARLSSQLDACWESAFRNAAPAAAAPMSAVDEGWEAA